MSDRGWSQFAHGPAQHDHMETMCAGFCLCHAVRAHWGPCQIIVLLDEWYKQHYTTKRFLVFIKNFGILCLGLNEVFIVILFTTECQEHRITSLIK